MSLKIMVYNLISINNSLLIKRNSYDLNMTFFLAFCQGVSTIVTHSLQYGAADGQGFLGMEARE